MTQKRKHLVTGGSGFLGSALVKRLLRDGQEVRVFDNNSRGALRRLEEVEDQIEFVEGDIRKLSDLQAACEGVDCIWHLAFINGTKYFYSHPDLVLDVGVRGMLNVLDAGKEAGVKELILASSSEVYQQPSKIPTDESEMLRIPDPHNPRYSYGGGKLISELLSLHNGQKIFDRVLIFRPHNVYGPDMGFEHVIPEFILRANEAPKDKLSKFSIFGTGEATRAFIFIDDFVEGLIHLYHSGESGEIYHIGTEDEVSIADVARLVAKQLERDIELAPQEAPKGETQRRCPDTKKIRALGFNPVVSLEEGLAKTIPWYLANAPLKEQTAL